MLKTLALAVCLIVASGLYAIFAFEVFAAEETTEMAYLENNQ